MRELKYRVYDKTEKCYSDKAFSIDRLGICYVQDEDGYGEEVDEERYIIEQYTGLKDKNGKEIYEGDILGGIWESGFISWCEKCKQLQYHSADIGCMACSGDVYWYELAEDDGKLEVIGNVHENANLLDEK